MPLFGFGKKDLDAVTHQLNDETDSESRTEAVTKLLEVYDSGDTDLATVVHRLLDRSNIDRDQAVLRQVHSGIGALMEVLEESGDRDAMQKTLDDGAVNEAFHRVIDRVRSAQPSLLGRPRTVHTGRLRTHSRGVVMAGPDRCAVRAPIRHPVQ